MNESSIFGISIRAYIVFTMVTAFVVMNFMKLEIDQTFSTLVVSLISYYFGQRSVGAPANTSTTIESTTLPVNEVKT